MLGGCWTGIQLVPVTGVLGCLAKIPLSYVTPLQGSRQNDNVLTKLASVLTMRLAHSHGLLIPVHMRRNINGKYR